MSINGVFKCPVSEDWRDHQDRSVKALERVNDMHSTLKDLSPSIKALSKLESIATESAKQTVILQTVQDKLITAATGREPLTAKIMGVVITGLIIVIVFLLTGEKMGFVRGLH